jgi:hypothetical protein
MNIQREKERKEKRDRVHQCIESPPAESFEPPPPIDDAAAALAADCKADSPIVTGTATDEPLPAADNNDGVLLLVVAFDAVAGVLAVDCC